MPVEPAQLLPDRALARRAVNLVQPFGILDDVQGSAPPRQCRHYAPAGSTPPWASSAAAGITRRMGGKPNRFLVEYDALPEGGRVARLTIDNHDKRNSLDAALMREIIDKTAAVAADSELRLAILSGAGGRAFVGGADIAEIAGLDRASARGFITLVHGCCAGFRRLPVPVVARIDGFALGAGLELAAACDLRVASETSAFGMPEVRIGIPSVVEAA